MLRALFVACVLAVAAAAGQSSPSAGERDSGVLAVMRRDGLLIPFAGYRESRWRAPWPATTRNRALPVNLNAIPDEWWGGAAPQTWRLHLPGGAARPLTVIAPRVYRTFCDTRVGLVTDYRSGEPVPLPPAEPFPKDGLASSSPLEVLPVESVDPTSPETMRLAQELMTAFDKAEDETVRLIRNVEGWSHPVKREIRRTRPVTIEALYRAPLDEPGWTASYVEAVRSYQPGPNDDGCGLETLFTGWIHEKAGDPRTTVKLIARVTYCDRQGAIYMLPLGRIHVANQLYWVYQLSGFENEWYVVARMSAGRTSVVVEAYGGSREMCPPVPRLF